MPSERAISPDCRCNISVMLFWWWTTLSIMSFSKGFIKGLCIREKYLSLKKCFFDWIFLLFSDFIWPRVSDFFVSCFGARCVAFGEIESYYCTSKYQKGKWFCSHYALFFCLWEGCWICLKDVYFYFIIVWWCNDFGRNVSVVSDFL